MFDLISIGDSTHDTFVEIDEASVLCDIKPNKCLLCLSWADKIPAKKVTQVPGVGNSANAAVGAARLGLNTAIYTHIGDDLVGESILKVFQKEKVNTRYVKIERGRTSNYSVVLNYGAERTIIVKHEKWRYNLPKKLKTKWIYYSSLGPDHSKVHRQIKDLVDKENINLVFQPGTYQLREGRDNLYEILCSSYLILLNKEEAAILLDEKPISVKSTNREVKMWVKHLARGLYGLGPHIVVITDGPNGAYAYDGSDTWYIKAYPLKAKERTGAGDSFSIGFTAALIRGKSVSEALLWGNANATSVVQYTGAQKGLLTEAGIRKMIRKYPKIKPRKI